MMRLLKTIGILLMLLLGNFKLQAQVWFPEGVYNQSQPSLLSADNQLITVAKAGTDNINSYWQVCVNEGSVWRKLPLLTLNKTAEVLDVKKYAGQIYLAGNFTFNSSNALVRFTNSGWQGMAQFKRNNSAVATISALDIHKNKLLVGGNFYTINQDTIPYLAKFNAINFSLYFDQCVMCAPDNAVKDIASNDSFVAISGEFNTINQQKSKYLYRINLFGKNDTFFNNAKVLDKIAMKGHLIYGVDLSPKNKILYEVNQNFTELKLNMDSILSVSEILIFNGQLLLSGDLKLNAQTKHHSVSVLTNNQWYNINLNYKQVLHIACNKQNVWAVGNTSPAISVWNPSTMVVRLEFTSTLLKIKTFLDSNNNCIQEANERPLPKQLIRIPVLGKAFYSNQNGMAECLLPNLNTTTYRTVIKPFRNLVRSNCADTVVLKTVYFSLSVDSIQFPLNRIPNLNDLKVQITSNRGSQVVKDKKVTYTLTYENVGSNQLNGYVVLKKNPLFTGEVATPNFSSKLNDSVLVWAYTTLNPGDKRSIQYEAYPNNAVFDQVTSFDAKVTAMISSNNDVFPSDNTDSIAQQVNPSIRAFRKDIFPAPSAGDSIAYLDASMHDLRYNISINNFGADTVFYAVIIDTLDLNLDMSYVEETGSNKYYYTEVQTDPNNHNKGILIWHFPNIKLYPNSIKDFENTNSNAYIGYKIVCKPLKQGYFLRNTASVYFDNQYVGSTNSVYCALTSSSIDQTPFNPLTQKLYPQPCSDVLSIRTPILPNDVLTVYNALGQLQTRKVIDQASEVYDLSVQTWPKGVYVLQLQHAQQTYNTTFIVD